MLKVEKELEEIITCTICLEPSYTSITCFSCSNLFCAECLARLQTYKKTCPMCRKIFKGYENKVLDNRVQIVKEFILLNRKKLKLMEDCDFLSSTLARMDVKSKNKNNFLAKLILLHQKIAESEDNSKENLKPLLEATGDMLMIRQKIEIAKETLKKNFQAYLKNVEVYLLLKKDLKEKVLNSLDYEKKPQTKFILNIYYFFIIYSCFITLSGVLYLLNLCTGGYIFNNLPLFK